MYLLHYHIIVFFLFLYISILQYYLQYYIILFCGITLIKHS